MEEQLFISSAHRLFGMLYIPEIANGSALLVIHPFGEEKKSSQRVLVDTAKTLTENGTHVLLFDLSGCGDSEGNMSDASVEKWISDIRSAAELLKARSGIGSMSIMGVRLGAYLAALYKEKYRDITKTILIEPVLEPAKYLHKTLRDKQIKELLTSGAISSGRDTLINELANDRAIDLNGYPITGAFYKSLLTAENSYPAIKLLDKREETILITTNKRSYKNREAKTLSLPHLRLCLVEMEPFWTLIDEPDHIPLVETINKMING